jgi:hypothetical protein
MKIPALMMPKNAVTTDSNMVTIPDPASRPSAAAGCTVKRNPLRFKFCNANDDFVQQLGSGVPLIRRVAKQPLIYHDGALPISAVFRLRYVHHLVRKWLCGDVQLPNAFA